MSEPICDVETAVRELGALPVPVGVQLTAEQRAKIAEQLGDAKPATPGLLVAFGESVRNRREHQHPTWEDLYCQNLSSYMGERMAPVLRRLIDAETRVAELEAERHSPPELVIYRASWDSMTLDQYTTEVEARKHAEDHARRDLPTATFDWIVDEEDGVAELAAAVDGEENPTGYTVTALEIASAYDPDGDE